MRRVESNDGLFHDPDELTQEEGTIVPAASMNAFQEELAGAIEAFGVVLDPQDNGQLAEILLGLHSGMVSANVNARRMGHFYGRR